jgi:hypothetical protein
VLLAAAEEPIPAEIVALDPGTASARRPWTSSS